MGLCNVSIVEISPERHLKGGLWACAKFLVDHRNKEGQENCSPLTSKVQAITERSPQIDLRPHESCVQVDKSCSQPFCNLPNLFSHAHGQCFTLAICLSWARLIVQVGSPNIRQHRRRRNQDQSFFLHTLTEQICHNFQQILEKTPQEAQPVQGWSLESLH